MCVQVCIFSEFVERGKGEGRRTSEKESKGEYECVCFKGLPGMLWATKTIPSGARTAMSRDQIYGSQTCQTHTADTAAFTQSPTP